MTREEYLKMPWHHEDYNVRTVDIDGELIYRWSRPKLEGNYWQNFPNRQGIYLGMDQVADWWRESLQTREQYLQLKNQSTNE